MTFFELFLTKVGTRIAAAWTVLVKDTLPRAGLSGDTLVAEMVFPGRRRIVIHMLVEKRFWMLFKLASALDDPLIEQPIGRSAVFCAREHDRIIHLVEPKR